jgi:hypothetical protein
MRETLVFFFFFFFFKINLLLSKKKSDVTLFLIVQTLQKKYRFLKTSD